MAINKHFLFFHLLLACFAAYPASPQDLGAMEIRAQSCAIDETNLKVVRGG